MGIWEGIKITKADCDELNNLMKATSEELMTNDTTESGKIDFESESKIALRVASGPILNGKDGWEYLNDWANSVAARVEEETIRRCGLVVAIDDILLEQVDRLYAPKKEGNHGT